MSSRRPPALGVDDYSIRWTGKLLPPTSGKYELVVGANDGFRLYIDGKVVTDGWEPNPRVTSKSAFVDLEGGKAYDLKLEYFEADRDAEVRLAWRLPGAKPPFDEALDAARAADVVIFVGGLTGDVEGEEMRVSYPGFAGGDRTDLLLPQSQQKLLDALQATGKPVILVLTAGSAIAVDREQAKLPAILMAWYPGQRGGNAVADVLFGATNPGGRLPVTFYKADEKLPDFEDYSMKNRTYRYFEGQPLYPFGHGLSYTKFAYSGLQARPQLGGRRRQRAGHGHGEECRQARRRRSRADVSEAARPEAPARAAGTARRRTRDAGARRSAPGVVHGEAGSRPDYLRRREESVRGRRGQI